MHLQNGQGTHLDPESPSTPAPDVSRFTKRRLAATRSLAMRVFRECLLLGNETNVRASVLDDLSTFYGFDRDECVKRCLHWEDWSVREWKQEEREDPRSIRNFYQSTESWSFDLLWYAYLQASGHAYPVSVAIAESLRRSPPPGGDHLDFGAGVGVTGQLFSRLGYRSTLSDVSTTLQRFARFRLERRNDKATFIDLNETSLGENRYDVITAIDTLVHIPDLTETIEVLHRALRPGGVLFANFDTRPVADKNAWHLYSDDIELRYQLQRAGFEPRENLDLMSTRYHKVETDDLLHVVRGVRDRVLLKSPLRRIVRVAKAQAQSLARRVLPSSHGRPPGS